MSLAIPRFDGRSIGIPIGALCLALHIPSLIWAEGVQAPGLRGRVGAAFEFQGHSYSLTSQSKTWTEAQGEAVVLGGHLVAVNSQEENDFLLASFFMNAGEALWIGLSDQEAEGEFRWSNDEPLIYQNWAAGEPNDFGGEDFVSIKPDGFWNDLAGTRLLAGIMEFTVPIGTSEQDREALIALYLASGGDGWLNNNWKSKPLSEDGFNDDPCSVPVWSGVSCQAGRVFGLDLAGNSLKGTLPAELGSLLQLRDMNLAANPGLTGPIPPQLGNLSELTTLDLSFNQLSGMIPASLGNLSHVTILNLSFNLLHGSIPAELAGVESDRLSSVLLAGNQLQGQVPAAIAMLPTGVLDLRHNRLESVEGGLTDSLDDAQQGSASWISLQSLAAVFPQMVIGEGFKLVLMLSNKSPELPWSGRVYLDGGLWPPNISWAVNGEDMTGRASFHVSLETDETRKLVMSSSTRGPFTGWLSLVGEDGSDPRDLSPALFYNLSDESGLTDTTGVFPSDFSSGFRFPVEQSENVFTGVAIRGVGAPVGLAIRNSQGEILAETSIDRNQTMLVNELFSGLPGAFSGWIQATSSSPFFVSVIRGEESGSGGVQLTSVAATAFH